MQQTQLEYRVASAAIKGARSHQEDSIGIWPREGGEPKSDGMSTVLAVLSDGMGGHVSGEIASGLACSEYLKEFLESSGGPETRLGLALTASNSAIARAIRSDPKMKGMGCTIVAAYLDSEGLRWASVGDSSLLLFRNKQLYRLNEDHSLGALLDKQVRNNLISREEALASPNRRSLRSALTGVAIPQTELHRAPERLAAGDILLVASDGLDTLTGNDIARIAYEHRTSSPRQIAEAMLREVDGRRARNQDNTSIVAITVQGVDGQSTMRIPARNGEAAGLNGSLHSAVTEVISPLPYDLVGVVLPEPTSSTTEPLAIDDRHPVRTAAKWSIIIAIGLAIVFALGNVFMPEMVQSVLNSVGRYAPASGTGGDKVGQPASKAEMPVAGPALK